MVGSTLPLSLSVLGLLSGIIFMFSSAFFHMNGVGSPLYLSLFVIGAGMSPAIDLSVAC